MKGLLTNKSWHEGLYYGVIGMLGGAAMVLLSELLPALTPPRIATVDITGLVNQFIKQETAQHLPLDALKAQVQQFSTALDKSVAQVAKQQHLILVPQQAVIAGAPNATPLVVKAMQAQWTKKAE